MVLLYDLQAQFAWNKWNNWDFKIYSFRTHSAYSSAHSKKLSIQACFVYTRALIMQNLSIFLWMGERQIISPLKIFLPEKIFHSIQCYLLVHFWSWNFDSKSYCQVKSVRKTWDITNFFHHKKHIHIFFYVVLIHFPLQRIRFYTRPVFQNVRLIQSAEIFIIRRRILSRLLGYYCLIFSLTWKKKSFRA